MTCEEGHLKLGVCVCHFFSGHFQLSFAEEGHTCTCTHTCTCICAGSPQTHKGHSLGNMGQSQGRQGTGVWLPRDYLCEYLTTALCTAKRNRRYSDLETAGWQESIPG